MQFYQLLEMAKKYTEYDMIQTHTDLPAFPEYRTRLLYTFLEKGSTKAKSNDLLVLVGSLIQMGLDTHELVNENPINEQQQKQRVARSQQLKVLAGDYFSSRFYHLLAQAGHIEFIKHFSEAICEVNRLKTNLYMKVKQLKITADDYIQQTVHIKSHMYLSFSKFMDDTYLRVWPEILHGFTKCEVLINEINELETSQTISSGYAYWDIIQNGSKEDKVLLKSHPYDAVKRQSLIKKYNIINKLHAMLETQLQQVGSILKQFEAETLFQDLYKVNEHWLNNISKTKVLEEI